MRFVDFLKTQYFLEAGFRDFIKSILVAASTEPQVDGFLATLTAGLSISIAPGQAVDMEGDFYNSPDVATVVELAAANPANPRIDMVVAKITANVPSQLEAGKKYRELLTYPEVAARVVPLESNHDVFTELWMNADIEVKQGVAAAIPVAPALDDDEIPLWEVRVEAAAVALTNNKLTDRRNLMRSMKDPFDIVLHTGLAKVVGPFGRILLSGVIASAEELGMIKIGPQFGINPDGTLTIANITEQVQDALLLFFPDAAPFDWTVNDVGNYVALDIATATTLLKGFMSAADKAKLDASTSANTASALVQRTSNGDFNGRDIKAERNHVFSDNSIMPSAARVEEIVEIINLQTNFNIGAGVPGETVVAAHSAIGSGSHQIEIHIRVEDYTNIPVCLEAVCAPNVAGGSVQLQLYNATDGIVLASISKSTAQDPTPRVGRSAVFNFTGTGRKRLVLRGHSSNDSVGGCVTALWRARLILNPNFSTCGMDALAACPV